MNAIKKISLALALYLFTSIECYAVPLAEFISEQLITPNEYCNLITSENNPLYKGYKKIESRMKENDIQFNLKKIYSENKLINDWVVNKFISNQIRFPDVTLNYFWQVEKICKNELLDSNYVYKDLGDFQSDQRRIFNQYKNELDACKSEKIRKIDDNGNISIVGKSCEAESKKFYDGFYVSVFLPHILMFKNSDKVVSSAIVDDLARLDLYVNNAIEERHKNEVAEAEKNAKAAAAMAEINAKEAAKNAKEAANREIIAARINKMKTTGDYSTAANCSEIASAMGAIKDDFLFPPTINPDNKVYLMTANLEEFNGTNGYIKNFLSNPNYAQITTTKNTIWKSIEKIMSKYPVGIVGRYIANNQVILVTGAAQPVRKFEVICIEPW